ncbi:MULTISPECIES: hypothetical protein [Streptomyces]|uniref:Uncharacterized protein n=1 Tax=Streptomyces doudnae TaxID=3075536 RepID=A0ABD5EZB8_9ACTN|nr:MULTISPECIES: hypothetical protein [unclassified Streptomyces]MDT0438924.1 hypothetical protein [Streptomyces sp. DSM 41981]MYQ66724.1 hypothetical protein [Streptomyces sp. SID4950]SCE24450.1 hypothetical protein GA0115242_126910 [Streptomyces sp. SolWspMP-5a-2]
MPPQNGSPPQGSPLSPEAAVQEVLVRFDSYARVRGARDSLLSASRTGPGEEERSFEDLRRAVTRLREVLG